MQKTNAVRSSKAAALTMFALATACVSLTIGCSSGFQSAAVSPSVPAVALHGSVHGGQQPVSGSTIQLYAANQTGYGQVSTPLLTTTVTTGSSGGFGITGTYTCPTASTLVYLTATGGNPGLGAGGANPNLTMMAALGPCGNLSASTFISMNELTTVASAYALSPFMSSTTQLSTSAANTTGLTNAFSTVNKLVNYGTGGFPGSSLPAGATEPTSELNTLADILAVCINSAGGTAGDSTGCGTLFTAATPAGGTAPTDTVTAILNIAKNPSNNVTALFNTVPGTAPFQPTLSSAPTAFTVSLRYAPASTFSAPSASALDANGTLWVTNGGNNSITLLSAAAGTPTILTNSSLNSPSGIAFDATGNAWVPNKGNSTLSVFTAAGAGSVALSSNLSTPTAVAIDGQGLIWVTNSGSNSLTAVTPSGLNVTSSSVISTGGISSPTAVAINPR